MYTKVPEHGWIYSITSAHRVYGDHLVRSPGHIIRRDPTTCTSVSRLDSFALSRRNYDSILK